MSKKKVFFFNLPPAVGLVRETTLSNYLTEPISSETH